MAAEKPLDVCRQALRVELAGELRELMRDRAVRRLQRGFAFRRFAPTVATAERTLGDGATATLARRCTLALAETFLTIADTNESGEIVERQRV